MVRNQHPSSAPDLGREFDRFCVERPEVEEILAWAVRAEVAATGRTSYSLKVPWEDLRWRGGIDGGRVPFPMDDRFVALMTRKIITDYPDLAGLFELRPAPEADRWWAAYRARRGQIPRPRSDRDN